MAEALPAERGFSDGWVKYAWLVYLAGIPLELIGFHAHAATWILAIAGLVMFLPLYELSYRTCDARVSTAIVIATFAIGAITAPRLDAAICYFIYGAAFLAFAYEKPQWTTRAFVLYLAAVAVAVLAMRLPLALAAGTVVMTAVIGGINIRSAEMERNASRLRLAYAEVERLSSLAERERIARDLHDVVGHTLSLIVLKSELAAKLADVDPARAAIEIREVERVAREALGEVRSAIAGYRSSGVAQEIERAGAVLRSAGLRVEDRTSAVQLTAAQEGVLALAIREAVTNVLRHARASTVQLRLDQGDGACRFEISDDGRGDGSPEGLGLRGMRERVEAIGGSLERTIAGGTQLLVIIPTAGT
jgi:two-component system sensor histidine kinase DesK